MTVHYTPRTVDAWIESDQGRRDFLDWLAGDSPDRLAEQARIALIGWAPLDRLATIETCREWLYELGPHHPAADMLHARFVDWWLGTDREHDCFHRWAGTTHGYDAMCGGCWS